MQLWTQMAQQTATTPSTSTQQQQQNASSSSPSLTGLVVRLHPHYFSSATDMHSGRSPTLTSHLSGKHHPIPSSMYPTPPSSPKFGSTSTSSTSLPTPQQAALASMASQTLVQRQVSRSFWRHSEEGPADDWRPTPKEYQKLSSREKRQLCNKISARNFRNRRKGGDPISF
jgi:bZIP-type transcription factor MBZ1